MARNRFFEDESIDARFDKGLFKRIMKYAIPYKRNFEITLVLMVITTFLSLLGPYITKIIVDTMIPKKDIRGVVLIVVAFVLSIAVQIVLNIIRAKMMTKTGHSIIYDLRKDVFSNLQGLSFNYFDNRPAGKILIRVTSYINSLAGLLSDGVVNTITDLFTLFAVIVMMFLIDVKLTMVSLATCIPLAIMISLFQKVMRRKWRIVNNKNSNRTAYVSENIMGIKVIQAFARQDENGSIYHRLNKQCADTWMDAIKINNLFWPGVDGIATLGIVLTYIVGYKLLGAGEITVGILIAFTNYIGRFWQPINNMSALYNQFLNAMAYAERIFELIDEKPDIKDIPGAVKCPRIIGNVEFKNVVFGYEKDVTILNNVSFKVKSGETIALVGPTGAGKSTIVNLISRFYDITGGAVMIDGVDVSSVTLKSLREQMGIMMQDTFIFSGTIMENIRYGRLDATDEEVIEAAKSVYVDEFIAKLPNGYMTEVDERGASLSTGERQLLSFARTILADPKILILDEATSSIDTKTERLIQMALQKLLSGRTSFIIAHRLSTIKNADRIMYVSDGQIIESGTHDELLKLDGEYRKLYMSQYRYLNNAA